MNVQTINRGPSWGFIFIVILSCIIYTSYSESLTYLNDLYSAEINANPVKSSSISKTYKSQHGSVIFSGERRFEKPKETEDSLHVYNSSTNSMNHQQGSSATNREENNIHSSTNNGTNDDNRSSDRYGAGSSRNPPVPNLSDGGGFVGVLRRVAGLVPMLTSKISSQMGLSRRRRQINENTSSSTAHSISQQHLDTIENLNRYYSSLTNSTLGRRPTPEEVKIHRKYLLNLLQQMRHSNRDEETPSGQSHIQNSLTKSQQELLNSPSDSYKSPSSTEIRTVENSTSAEHDVHAEFRTNSANITNPDITLETQFANRVGQTSDYADIQKLDIDKAALLLHQFQTQGSVNILPPNFLGNPSAQEPPRKYDVFYQQQQATRRMGMPADTTNAKLPRHADGFVQEPSWTFRNSPMTSLTSANIDPISGQYHPPVHSRPTISVSVPDSYDKTAHSLPGVYISETTAQPSFYDYGQISQTGEGKLVLPQDSSNIQKLPALAGTTSILDNFPDQSALINPQNIPDLIEGIKILTASSQNTQSLSFADIIQRLPVEFFLNSNIYSDYDTLINALRIYQQYNDNQAVSNPTIVSSSASQPQNLIDLTSKDSINTNLQQLYNQGYNPNVATVESASNPQVVPVRGNQIANTRLTTEVSDAISTFVTDITTAITDFLTNLAAAIEANPVLLLLGLIPFAFLVYSLYQHYGIPTKHGGYSSGGQSTYGRTSFMPKRPYENAEDLAKRILTDINTFEKWAKSEYS